jgi:hypothetical protein
VRPLLPLSAVWCGCEVPPYLLFGVAVSFSKFKGAAPSSALLYAALLVMMYATLYTAE